MNVFFFHPGIPLKDYHPIATPLRTINTLVASAVPCRSERPWKIALEALWCEGRQGELGEAFRTSRPSPLGFCWRETNTFRVVLIFSKKNHGKYSPKKCLYLGSFFSEPTSHIDDVRVSTSSFFVLAADS